jgi:hypothetical protein
MLKLKKNATSNHGIEVSDSVICELEDKTKEFTQDIAQKDKVKCFLQKPVDKGLTTRIYRELKKLNSRKINDPNERMCK